MKVDPTLKEKVERMKVLMEKFCPEVNQEFWKEVETKALNPSF